MSKAVSNRSYAQLLAIATTSVAFAATPFLATSAQASEVDATRATQAIESKSNERLSTGIRINESKDDASGLILDGERHNRNCQAVLQLLGQANDPNSIRNTTTSETRDSGLNRATEAGGIRTGDNSTLNVGLCTCNAAQSILVNADTGERIQDTDMVLEYSSDTSRIRDADMAEEAGKGSRILRETTDEVREGLRSGESIKLADENAVSRTREKCVEPQVTQQQLSEEAVIDDSTTSATDIDSSDSAVSAGDAVVASASSDSEEPSTTTGGEDFVAGGSNDDTLAKTGSSAEVAGLAGIAALFAGLAMLIGSRFRNLRKSGNQ